MKKIICIPAYNEEKTIGDMIKKAKPFADLIIVCNDGSIDNTSEVAKREGSIVLEHKSNLGKGAAMKTLFNYARENNADVMVTIDGDGQFLPEEIPRVIEPILKGTDIVIGNRFSGESDMPNYRKVGNKVLDKFTSLASDLPFKDTQGGFRAYSKKAIMEINFSTNGFGVDSEILVNASKKDLIIQEVNVTVLYNTGNKTSTKNPLSHSSEVVGSLLEIIAVNHPLKYVGLPGLILLVTGIIFGSIVLITFNEIRYFSIPYTLITMASITMGLLLLMMSIVLYSINNLRNKNT